MSRHRNKGVRKLCDCDRKAWPKCAHPWHFNFRWRGQSYRFSLDRQLGRHIETKTDAETEADRIRGEIKAGTFGSAAPVLSSLTIDQLFALYVERVLLVKRPARIPAAQALIRMIVRTPLPLPAGGKRPFGEWYVADVTADTLERFREVRLARGGGPVAVNRNLGLLSTVFNWGIGLGYVGRSPFKRATQTIVKQTTELPRSRRLEPGEAEALFAACDPLLRAIVEAAIETGCRQGELLSLQWRQVQGDPPTAITLPAAKTKTGKPRSVPVSSRLRAILEMRRTGPNGHAFGPECYVFGDEAGRRTRAIKAQWARTVLRAHGVKIVWAKNSDLTPECWQALAAIDLHFHDLRREAGSRWLESGVVPIMVIRDWLGHTNVAQTSTYLASTARTQADAMQRYEERLQTLANPSQNQGRSLPQSAEQPTKPPQQTTVGRVEPSIH